MDEMVTNIISIWKLSTAQEKRDGIVWYIDAHKECEHMAETFRLPVYQCAGVVSALSPNNKWEINVRNAYEMCTNYIDGGDIDDIRVSTYHTMKRKAWSILDDKLTDDDDILTRLNGQKIRSFYSNIRGLNEVTIDGHAFNIAQNVRHNLTDDKTNIGKKLYRELQDAYVRAAKRVDVAPHELQAITWTTWRREHGIK